MAEAGKKFDYVLYEGEIRGKAWSGKYSDGSREPVLSTLPFKFSHTEVLTNDTLRAAIKQRSGDFEMPVEFECVEAVTRTTVDKQGKDSWRETTVASCRRIRGEVT